jgi:hypothetical protein
MKRNRLVMLCISLLVLVSVFGIGRSSNAAATEVVVVACTASSGQTFRVERSSRTSGAPDIVRGTSCAQTLADLIDLGYQIKQAQPYVEGMQAGVAYTLTNP